MPLDPPVDDPPEHVREILAPIRNGISIAVETAGNAFAVGAIIRVAHSYLVRDVVLIGSEPHYEKASMGMHRFERIVRVEDDDAFFRSVAPRPVYAFEREHARRSLYEIESFPDDAVFLFGSERFGLSRETLSRCDDVIGIPLFGINNSLPLAVAVGIGLSFWAHRRYADGTIVVGPPR